MQIHLGAIYCGNNHTIYIMINYKEWVLYPQGEQTV